MIAIKQNNYHDQIEIVSLEELVSEERLIKKWKSAKKVKVEGAFFDSKSPATLVYDMDGWVLTKSSPSGFIQVGARILLFIISIKTSEKYCNFVENFDILTSD